VSDTPRTDAVRINADASRPEGLAAWAFARHLERELSETKKELATISESEINQAALDDLHVTQGMLMQCREQLAEALLNRNEWRKVAEGLRTAYTAILADYNKARRERDEWRKVAEKLAHAIEISNRHGYGLRIGEEAAAAFHKLKEESK
jgi:hypothetical protein